MALPSNLVTKDQLLFYHQGVKGLLDKRVLKEDGKSLLSDTEIERLKTLKNYDDSALKKDLADNYAKSTDVPKVPAWALAEKKPVYTATEVSADAIGAADTALTNAKAYTDAEIVKIKNSSASAMHYKGSVQTYDELPKDADVGDCYNIVQASDHNKAGDNAIYTQEKSWDVVAGFVDLSKYVSIEDLTVATNKDIQDILES